MKAGIVWMPFLLIMIGWAMLTEASAVLPHNDEFAKMLAVRLSDAGIGLISGGLTLLIPRSNNGATNGNGKHVPTAEQVVQARKERGEKDPTV